MSVRPSDEEQTLKASSQCGPAHAGHYDILYQRTGGAAADSGTAAATPSGDHYTHVPELTRTHMQSRVLVHLAETFGLLPCRRQSATAGRSGQLSSVSSTGSSHGKVQGPAWKHVCVIMYHHGTAGAWALCLLLCLGSLAPASTR